MQKHTTKPKMVLHTTNMHTQTPNRMHRPLPPMRKPKSSQEQNQPMNDPKTVIEIIQKIIAENYLEKTPELKKLLNSNPKAKSEFITILGEVRSEE